MKNVFILNVLNSVKSNPKFLKKLKIFAIVGVGAFLCLSVLGVWLGVKVVNYTYESAKHIISAPVLQGSNLDILNEFNNLQLNSAGCKDLANELLNVKPWLEQPLQQHFDKIKSACFESKVEKGSAI